MAILHLLNKPVATHDAVMDCLRTLQKGDGLVLIEDGVYLAHHDNISKAGITLYALQHDLHLRGLSPEENRLQIVDDAGLVDLCTRYEKTVSWF